MLRVAKNTIVVLVGLVAALGGSIAEAASPAPVVARTTVSFTLTSATCSNLPAHTTIVGSGTETSVTTQKTDRTGPTTIHNTTIATGTAFDQDGKSYHFLYANEARVTNSAAQPDVYSGPMKDLFVLAGSGPANLRNGFDVDLTTNAALTLFTAVRVRRAFGDPVSFDAADLLAGHCDPL